MNNDIIILCGGLGTRLRSVIQDMPKPMAEVNEKPFLSYLLNQVAKAGAKRVILSVGYKHEVISSFFGSRYQNMEIVYAIEETPLGTGGGLKLACKQVQTPYVTVLNGDSFIDVNLNALEKFNKDKVLQGAKISVVLKEMHDFDRYGTVDYSKPWVNGFAEKKSTDRGFINTGVYIFSPSIFENIGLDSPFSFEKEVLEKQAVIPHHIAGLVCDGIFIDIGIPQDYEKAQSLFPIKVKTINISTIKAPIIKAPIIKAHSVKEPKEKEVKSKEANPKAKESKAKEQKASNEPNTKENKTKGNKTKEHKTVKGPIIKKLPLISVITVCFNAQNHIERTFRSICGQTYTNIEYLIIDGKSRDNTLSTIKKLKGEYPNRNIKVYSEPDHGIYDAMNKGLDHATGDFVWFINAGDCIRDNSTTENFVLKTRSLACVPKVIYGETMLVDEHGKELGLRAHRAPKILNWKSFKRGMLVCHQSILVNRIIAPTYKWRKFGGASDIDWVIEALKRCKDNEIFNTNSILSHFLSGGYSAKHEKQSWKERYRIMVKHYGLLNTWFWHIYIAARRICRM